MAYKILLTKTLSSKNTQLSTNNVNVTVQDASFAKRLTTFSINSNDVSTRYASVYYTDDSSVQLMVGTVSVPPIVSNVNGIVDVMTSLYTFFKNVDGAGNRYFDMPINTYFSIQLNDISIGKLINCVTSYALYDPD